MEINMDEISKKFFENEILISDEALKYLKQQIGVSEIVDAILKNDEFKTKIVDVADIEKIIAEKSLQKKTPISIKPQQPKSEEPVKKSEINFEVKNSEVLSYTGKVDDFVSLFRDRYNKLSDMIEKRMQGVVEIEKVKSAISGREASVIGMVKSKTFTKNGVLAVIEDLTGDLKVYFPKNSPIGKDAEGLVNDEVIGVTGKISGSLFIANRIVQPDVEVRPVATSQKEFKIAFLSDLHVGSSLFLSKQFEAFLKDVPQIEGLKYIVISGDVVDGVGIYPNQEKELSIVDAYKQYEAFFDYMGMIPQDIHIFVLPGNHDVARRAEPQSFEKSVIKSFPNMTILTNPAYIKIDNLTILAYHGTSLDSIIAAIPGLNYTTISEAMREILKRRHLSPIYGTNPIAPIGRDELVIKEQPDILAMGHIHRNAFDVYKGVVLINSGTFQNRTEFQIKMGHIPTPGQVTIYDAHTGQAKIKNYFE